ncbi:hypothetical protein GQ53DRAFT_862813, partial [Thozetella sp. PMI_491]
KELGAARGTSSLSQQRLTHKWRRRHKGCSLVTHKPHRAHSGPTGKAPTLPKTKTNLTKLAPKQKKKKKKKTYNTGYSLVVTDPTTNPALTGLSRGERTGSRVLQWIWSYVLETSG